MSEMILELNKPPVFITNAKGKSTVVTLETAAYVKLLVQANVTNPQLWPPEMQKGASALARVREIERECVAQYGEFDWEQLPEKVQDELPGEIISSRPTYSGAFAGNIYLRLKSSIDELSNNPRPPGCRKMAGRTNEWRIRVGAFRIIYTIDDAAREVRIRKIGHRRDVYR